MSGHCTDKSCACHRPMAALRYRTPDPWPLGYLHDQDVDHILAHYQMMTVAGRKKSLQAWVPSAGYNTESPSLPAPAPDASCGKQLPVTHNANGVPAVASSSTRVTSASPPQLHPPPPPPPPPALPHCHPFQTLPKGQYEAPHKLDTRSLGRAEQERGEGMNRVTTGFGMHGLILLRKIWEEVNPPSQPQQHVPPLPAYLAQTLAALFGPSAAATATSRTVTEMPATPTGLRHGTSSTQHRSTDPPATVRPANPLLCPQAIVPSQFRSYFAAEREEHQAPVQQRQQAFATSGNLQPLKDELVALSPPGPPHPPCERAAAGVTQPRRPGERELSGSDGGGSGGKATSLRCASPIVRPANPPPHHARPYAAFELYPPAAAATMPTYWWKYTHNFMPDGAPFEGYTSLHLNMMQILSNSRGVFLKNIPKTVEVADITRQIRGGRVERIDFQNNQNRTCVGVFFVLASEAEKFIKFVRRRCHHGGVYWGSAGIVSQVDAIPRAKGGHEPIKPNIAKAIRDENASRVLIVDHIPENTDIEMLKAQVRRQTLKIVVEFESISIEDHSAIIKMSSIGTALGARLSLSKLRWYNGCTYRWGTDECEGPIEDLKDRWDMEAKLRADETTNAGELAAYWKSFV